MQTKFNPLPFLKRAWTNFRTSKANRRRLFNWLFMERPYLVGDFKKRIRHTPALNQGAMLAGYEAALADIMGKLRPPTSKASGEKH